MEILDGMLSAFRRLRNSSQFLLVTLTTLAVSMGASTTMFTVVNSFLLSSLPFEGADRLVMLWHLPVGEPRDGGGEELALSPGVFTDLRSESRSLEQVAGFFSEWVNVSEAAGVERVPSLFVAGDFFPLLRRGAAIGRTLGPEDEREGAAPAVVVSHAYWKRKLGGSPQLEGKTVEFGGKVWAVAGVMPPDFRFSESLVAADPSLSKPVDLWIPFLLGDSAHERGFHYLNTVGRLRTGVSLASVRGEMTSYARGAAERFPDTDRKYGIRVVTLQDQIFGRLRAVLLTLWAATAFVVLIACANVATLQVAREHTGHRDTSVRLALGASRSRIVREFLTESVGLSLAGGLLSLGVAYVATRLLTALNPVNVFESYPPHLDLRVVVFTLAVALGAGLLFGGPPALRASRADPAIGLSEGSTRLTVRSRRIFAVLVVAQIALATTLLIGMGLSLKSFRGLLRADLGVNLQNVLTLDLNLPRSPYRDEARKAAFFRDLLERVAALPGVESVGMNYALPFSGVDPSNGFEIEGRPANQDDDLSANLGFVNPDYFKTLSIPLLEGRGFLPSDAPGAPLVALVDRRMVEQYFGLRSPLGRRLSIGDGEKVTVVGVVGAVKQDAFEARARPYVYLPYPQRSYLFTSLAIKTSSENPSNLASSVRALVSGLDREVPISNVSTLEDAYRSAIAPQRFSLLLISLFAGLALFLMQIGTYGAMAYLARQRTREAGIRLALGAETSQIFGLVFKEGLALSVAGTAIGVGLALAAGRVFANLVHGVETVDPLVFVLVALATLAAAFAAYFAPARTLSRTDPSGSLSSF